jgi:hypothetical protein
MKKYMFLVIILLSLTSCWFAPIQNRSPMPETIETREAKLDGTLTDNCVELKTYELCYIPLNIPNTTHTVSNKSILDLTKILEQRMECSSIELVDIVDRTTGQYSHIKSTRVGIYTTIDGMYIRCNK